MYILDYIKRISIHITIITLLILLVSVGIKHVMSVAQQSVTYEGVVVDKTFTPSHTDTLFIPVVTGSSSVLVPYYQHYSDTYKIKIIYHKTNTVEEYKSFRVTKDVYDSFELGDYFIYDENYEPTYPEFVNERKKD